MSLTILGSHAGDVWVETAEGDAVCLTATDLAVARLALHHVNTVQLAGLRLDESDVTELTGALTGPELDDCADCDGPGLVVIEGRPLCYGHVAGYGTAEDESGAA